MWSFFTICQCISIGCIVTVNSPETDKETTSVEEFDFEGTESYELTNLNGRYPSTFERSSAWISTSKDLSWNNQRGAPRRLKGKETEQNARTLLNYITRAITHGRHETIILYKAGHSFKRETDSSFSLLFYIIIQKIQIFRYCFQF